MIRNDKGRPVQLYVGGGAVTDEDFAKVVHLPELTHIEVVYTRLTDDSIQYLLRLDKLQYVDLSFTRITPRAVRQLEDTRAELRVTYAQAKRYETTMPSQWTEEMTKKTRDARRRRSR